MTTTTNRDPAPRLPEKSSLLGVVEFHPRLAIVVIFLTIVVAVAGWRIFQESGAPRINALAEEAANVFVSTRAGSSPTAALDFAEAEKRIEDFSGVAVRFPGDDSGFVVSGVERRIMRKRPAVLVRFSYESERFLLVIFRNEKFLNKKSLALFQDELLLSGERDGLSFVFWERDNASFVMVSDAEMTHVFKLVRSFFT